MTFNLVHEKWWKVINKVELWNSCVHKNLVDFFFFLSDGIQSMNMEESLVSIVKQVVN